MIVSNLTLDIRPGASGELAGVFREHRILERAGELPGCRSLYLVADDDAPDRVHVLGIWEDAAAYQQWLDHPLRGVGREDLQSLVSDRWDPEAAGAVWSVLHSHPGVRPSRTDSKDRS